MTKAMNRKLAALGGAGVAVLGIVLWVWLRSGSHDDDAPASSDRSAGSAAGIDPAPKPVTITPSPSLPVVTEGAARPAAGSATEYAVGDVRIRDHRSGTHAPLDLPPNIHKPEARQLPSALTHAISQKVKAAMVECIASLPRESTGPSPRLEGTIFVTIKDHQLSISQATMALRDVFGAAADPVRQCVEHKAVTLSTPAPDEADMDAYSISVTFGILAPHA
jgi:hypothetical protein